VRIDTRWATANGTEIRRHAAELVSLAPDVILALLDFMQPQRAGGRLVARLAHLSFQLPNPLSIVGHGQAIAGFFKFKFQVFDLGRPWSRSWQTPDQASGLTNTSMAMPKTSFGTPASCAWRDRQ
jgi:hypothetical protein